MSKMMEKIDSGPGGFVDFLDKICIFCQMTFIFSMKCDTGSWLGYSITKVRKGHNYKEVCLGSIFPFLQPFRASENSKCVVLFFVWALTSLL